MKKVFRIHRTRGEEGMALLFALGFLALLLILGLGFVTTSLLSQKIAANNSSRAQARMLARSAAARAMLDVMLYNDQAILNGTAVENYDAIYSYDKVDYNDNGTTGTGALNDQLRAGTAVDADGNPKIPSKLKYLWYDRDLMGKNCKANWIYFYDSPEKENGASVVGRRIVGRVAFQVLPRQEGRLSLYAVTGGSKIDNDYRAFPHTYRWGRDIAELDLTNTAALPNWYDGSANPALTTGTVPFKYRTLYNLYHSFFPYGDSETDQTALKNKKRWIEYWFAEGRNTILGEAFPVLEGTGATSKTRYYNRFNISDYYYEDAKRNASGSDNWYDRFKTSVDGNKKNTAAALEALAGEAVAYNDAQTEDAKLDPSGLPFLKRIGNDKWSFETLEALRKQIAANFNDYCDADSIPTSNVPAANWDIDDVTKRPDYTGNERTLYINEVGVQIAKVGVHYNSADRGIGIKDDIDIKALVELINMYDNSDADKSGLLDPANLKVKFKLEELSFKIALYGKYTGRITYTGSDNKTKTVTVNDSNAIEVNKDYGDDKFRAEVKCTGAAVDISGTGTGNAEGKFSTLQNGYSVGRATVTAAVTNPDGSDFNDAVMEKARELAKNANGGIAPDPNTVKFAVRNVVAGYEIKLDENSKIRLSPMMLATNKPVTVDGSTVPSGTGLDFVRFDRVEAMTLSGSDLGRETGMRISSADAVKNKTYFIGGIEAKDPRQNLNPRKSDSSDVKSDWKIAPKFRTAAAVAAADSGVPTMIPTKVSTAGYDYEVDISKACGKLNSDANPSGRDTEDVGDKETATDPAWLGTGQADSEHPVAQHVSTAYIRNAPMVSPWEIGLIHRGREWQTLRLTRAGGFGNNVKILLADIQSNYPDWTGEGTKYENGDGAILEFVKVGTGCRCMGKIPLDKLRTGVIASGNADWNGVDAAYNKDIIKMLFHGIRAGQTMKQFYAETKFNGASVQGGEAIDTGNSSFNGVPDEFVAAVDSIHNNASEEFKLRSQFLNSKYGDKDNDFTFGVADTNNDAGREEIIGKTINLLTVGATAPPNVFRVIVVAQTINDVGGIGADVPITKIHKEDNGDGYKIKSKGLMCQIGRFDFISDKSATPNWENNTYYDEITGEVKALVTIERIPATNYLGEKNTDCGRLVVTGIEFIE